MCTSNSGWAILFLHNHNWCHYIVHLLCAIFKKSGKIQDVPSLPSCLKGILRDLSKKIFSLALKPPTKEKKKQKISPFQSNVTIFSFLNIWLLLFSKLIYPVGKLSLTLGHQQDSFFASKVRFFFFPPHYFLFNFYFLSE